MTTLELARRLRAVRPDVEVVGLEIDPERVAAARRWPQEGAGGPPARPVRFERGGFELGPVAAQGRAPVLVRAANVLRQYPEAEVAGAWAQVVARLAPDGLLVDATCDERGRRAGMGGGQHPLTLSAWPDRAAAPAPGGLVPAPAVRVRCSGCPYG